MSSSWSNAPLDLLISIRKKLQNADLSSFRSVCSQWRYASPILTPCRRRYEVTFNKENNMIELASFIKDGSTHELFFSLPFSLSSPYFYYGHSNGWLIFGTNNNKILHLFDPVSNRKFILPPLNQKLLRYYKKVKPTVHDANDASFLVVVVSSSLDGDVAAAGIVKIKNRTKSTELDRRIIFYRHANGDCQRWSLLMEESKGLTAICLAGDGRFYAISHDRELYILHERPPFIKLIKVKLWLPKDIFEAWYENCTGPVKSLRIKFYGMKKSGETDIKVYAYCEMKPDTFRMRSRYISLKINVAKLNGYSNNVEAACDAEWTYEGKFFVNTGRFFTPLFKEHHSKLSVKI